MIDISIKYPIIYKNMKKIKLLPNSVLKKSKIMKIYNMNMKLEL